MRADRVGADTVLAEITRMVEDAQGAKLPIQAVVDRITLWFVPAVLVLASLTVAAWLFFGPGPGPALIAGVSVLIIACPCAMGLATPMSILVGSGRAADMGVLFRKGDALQGLDDVAVVALDKTGTVTEGRPVLSDMIMADGLDEDDILAAIAAVETRSQHPIASAIVALANDRGLTLPEVTEVQSETGYGLRATVDGRVIRIGADRMMQRDGIDLAPWNSKAMDLAGQGRTVVYAAIDERVAALIAVSDPVKDSSRSAITALKEMGKTVVMITGDRRDTAEAVAREVGVDHVVAEVLPGGKVEALDGLRATHGPVAFVGDGINDAPALANADVGIAIGTGTDVAIEAADVVLISGDLSAVVNAAVISGETMRNIRQNLAWAFGYNLALIPIAAGVLYPAFGLLLSPIFAAGAMALSSVSVVTNALRLRRIEPATDTPAVTFPKSKIAKTEATS
jgi:Cu+-exporting ATPase